MSYECVILYRVKGGPVEAVMNASVPEIAVYPDMDAAIAFADSNKLFASGQADYQIVELDEL